MNRLFLLLFGMVTLVAHAQVPDYVPTEGLVAWYPFNGNANDESGNGHHGIVNGAVLDTDQNGISSSSYYFDGNARIDIPNHEDFDLNEMTFIVRYQDFDNPQAHPNGNSVLATKQPGDGWGSGWGFGAGNQTSEFSRCMTSTAGNQCLGWGQQEYGNWMFATYTHSVDSIVVTINGEVVAENVANGGFISNSLDVTIGMRGNGWHQFIGSISEIGFWDRALTQEEITTLYNEQLPIPGCTDSTACNYNDEANEDDGTCTYPPFGLADCEAGGALCGEGTIWDASLQACVGFNDCPSDLDGDGLIGVEDLLSLLSGFGTDCGASDDPETAEWACGNPVSYHGYDYATVQIGEQCWFAENVKFLPFLEEPNGVPGQAYVYDYYGSSADEARTMSNYDIYGALYDFNATINWPLCPTGWVVPSYSQFLELFNTLGGVDSAASAMLSSEFWPEEANALNSSGFSSLPSGWRYTSFGELGQGTHFWTRTEYDAPRGYAFYLTEGTNWQFNEVGAGKFAGQSVRCLKY